MNWNKVRITDERAWIHFLLIITVVIIFVSLWSTMGFDTAALSDNFRVRTAVDRGVVFRLDVTRLFGSLPTFVGNYIDPNGFIGTNLVLLSLSVIRVVLVYFIIYNLSKNLFISFYTALLYSVFPLTWSIFKQGALGTFFGADVFLLAALLYVLAHTSSTDRRKLIASVLAIPFLIVSSLVHPSYFVLAGAMPILVYIIYRNQVNFKLSFAWYFCLASVASLYIYSLSQGSGRNSKAGKFDIDSFLSGYVFVYKKYLRVFRKVDFEYLTIASMVIVPLVIIIYARLGKHQFTENVAASKKLMAYIVFAAVAVIVSAYMPYALSKVKSTDRTLLLANIGYCLLFATFMYYLARSKPLSSYYAVLVVILIVFVGFYSEMHAKALTFRDSAAQQQTILANIFRYKHNLRDKLVLVEFDRPDVLYTKGFYGKPSMQLVYYTEYNPRKIRAYSLPFSKRLKHNLIFNEDEVIVEEKRRQVTYDWDDVILYSVAMNGDVKFMKNTSESKYFREKGINIDIPAPKHIKATDGQSERIARLMERVSAYRSEQ